MWYPPTHNPWAPSWPWLSVHSHAQGRTSAVITLSVYPYAVTSTRHLNLESSLLSINIKDLHHERKLNHWCWYWGRGFPFIAKPIWRQQEEARDPETFQVSQAVPYPPVQTGWMIFLKFSHMLLIEELTVQPGRRNSYDGGKVFEQAG